MAKLILVSLTLISAVLGIPSSRIIGGWDVDYHNSGVVSLRSASGNHFCAGSILNENWVITAAHCIFTGASPLSVVAGSSSLTDADSVSIVVSEVVVHPDFHELTLENDVALLRVETPFAFGEWISPLFLEPQTALEIDSFVWGWGSTSGDAGEVSDELQLIKLKTITNEACAEAWGSRAEIFDTNICTNNAVGQGVCNGDAGGPLMHLKTKVIGIVSFWSSPCADGTPDVYSRVEHYYDWVESIIN